MDYGNVISRLSFALPRTFAVHQRFGLQIFYYSLLIGKFYLTLCCPDESASLFWILESSSPLALNPPDNCTLTPRARRLTASKQLLFLSASCVSAAPAPVSAMSPPNNNASLPSGLRSPPPPVPDTLVSFPAPHVLLVTLNRPKQLNCIPRPQHFALERLWDWYDEEPTLRCAVITGTGRAFCAGADLKEWNAINTRPAPSSSSRPTNSPSIAPSQAGITPSGAATTPQQQQQQQQPDQDKPTSRMPRGGFGGMSNRPGAKPILAAANGICFGGGMEMAINCDMVIASSSARFALPEVTIGVIALAGALPRLARSVGKQRASEMALSGKSYTADEMKEWGLVNEVVAAEGDVVAKALEWAGKIAGNSPDAVIVSREGLKLGWEGVGPEMGTDILIKGWYGRIEKGENMVEGVKSFNEKLKPVWKNSKL